jgi:hypothetical protein
MKPTGFLRANIEVKPIIGVRAISAVKSNQLLRAMVPVKSIGTMRANGDLKSTC